MSFRVRLTALLSSLLVASGLPIVMAGPAHAAVGPPVLVGLAGSSVFTFSAATPGTIASSSTVSGLQAGDTLVDLEYRPLTGQLLAIGQTHLYTLNPANGVLSVLGGPVAPASTGTAFGSAYIPTTDQLRVVSDTDMNRRLNPANAASAGTDTTLTYAVGDPNVAANPSVVALGYTNDFAGAATTTAYGIDSGTDSLVRLGSAGGAPSSPDAGQLTTVGALAVDTGTLAELDIHAPNGTAYAVLTPPAGTTSSLYTINLGTGAATLVGAIGGGTAVRAMAATSSSQMKFSSTSFSLGEAGGSVTVSVTRTTSTNEGATTVDWATSNGTAEAGQDYTASNGTLNFPDSAGANTQTFTVPITNDAFIEGPEAFTVTLSNPTAGASLGTPTTATVNIADNENGTLYGLTDQNKITQVSVNNVASQIASVSVTGLQSGETLTSIDFRPATSQLLGVGTTGRLYAVNPVSGAATQIGSPMAGVTGGDFGSDVNPVTDTLRLVSDTETNLRINPDTAVATPDTALAYAVGDAAFGTNPNVVALAHTNNLPGAVSTTAYGIDSGTDSLVRLGSVDGAPTSPNSGQLTTLAPLGQNVSDLSGFDVVGGGGAAFVALTSTAISAPSRVYRIDLATGALTHLGLFGGNHPVRAIAVAPPGRFNLSAATYSAAEAAGSLSFTVNRTLGAPVTEAVNYAVGPGTATSGTDFTGTTGTLTFNGSETSKTVAVTLLDDAVDEPDETFTITLSSPTNGTSIGTGAAVATITDDDLTTLFATTSANRLISLRTDSLAATTTDVAITGLQPAETVVGLDSRPSNRTLYALGSTGRLYTVDVTSGAATVVGSASALTGTAFGADVDPVAGNLRVVSDADVNEVRNLSSGAVTAGTALAYPASGDASSGVNPNVVAIGYTNNVPGAASTTLYGIDSGTDKLVRVGSVGGSPSNAGTGVLTTVGALGVNTTDLAHLDLDPHGDLAFASLTAPAGTTSQLYRVNLTSGAAGLIGTIPGGSTITGLAVAPLATLVVAPATLTPVSGTATTVTVTAKGANNQTDTAYTAKPVLTSTDTHFTPGTCAAAVNGVATCTGVVFGDLGQKILTATAAGATGNVTVNVQPTGLAFTTAPAGASRNTPTTYVTAPVAGVSGASLAGYSATQTMTVSGGDATPQTITQPCAGPTCAFTTQFPSGGSRTIGVTDTSTPARSATANTAIKKATTVTIKVAKIVYSDEVSEVSGRLLAEGAPLPANTLVNISYRFVDKPNFVLLGQDTTDANGVFTLTRIVKWSLIWKVDFLGSNTAEPSTSAVGQAVRTRIRVDHASFIRGVLHFDGFTFPAHPGAMVALYLRRADGSYLYFGSPTRLNAQSGFSINRRLGPGRYNILIHIGDTKANLNGNSVTFPLTVR